MRTIISSLAISFLVANTCIAADSCGAPARCRKTHDSCGRCGVPKTCKVICEMKKVKKTVWAVECEEFCASLPRCARTHKPCGGCGEASCDSCGDPCASLRRPIVPPKCGKVRSRKKLVKKEITCEVPVYKFVVVCCNVGCGSGWDGSEEEAVPTEAPVPEEKTADAAPSPPILSPSSLQALRLAR